MESGSSPRTPLWFVLVIILSILPILVWPAIISQLPPNAAQNYRLLITIFPIYAVGSGYLAYKSYPQRSGLAWILIILLWLCYGAAALL